MAYRSPTLRLLVCLLLTSPAAAHAWFHCLLSNPSTPSASPDDPPSTLCAGKTGAASCAEIVKEEKKKETALQLKIAFGLHGDRTDRLQAVTDDSGDEGSTRRVTDISFGLDVNHGTYPHEIRVKSATKFRDQDGETSEDVSSAMLQYDFHIRHDIQLFAFAERFADNFLAIDQRWEAGGGVSYERNLLDRLARKSAGRRLPEPSDPDGRHDLVHPLDVGLSCSTPRKWYLLTHDGYRKLEAWAGHFDAARRAAEDRRKRAKDFEGACAVGSDSAAISTLTDIRALGMPETIPEETLELFTGSSPCDPPLRTKLQEWLNTSADTAEASVEALRAEFCGQHARSLEKRYSKFQPAISVALVAESEKATLKEGQSAVRVATRMNEPTNGDPTDEDSLDGDVNSSETAEEPLEIALDATQQIRLSLRPSLKYRPTSRLSLRLQYFWKWALDSPTKVDGTRDRREELRFEVKLQATDKFSVEWTVNRYTDPLPPVGEVDTPDGLSVATLRAFDTHWVYDLKIGLSL